MALATLLGTSVGWLLVAVYAYGTAEWWFTGRAAGYIALALVPLATAAGALATAGWVGRGIARGRELDSHPVLIAGLLIFAVAAIVRIYPLRELNYQLPGYLDTSPSLSRMIDELGGAQVPLLGPALGQTLSFVYLAIEAMVLLGALLLIARWSVNVPYCHGCKRNCRRTLDVARFASAPLVQVMERAKARDWSFFRSIGQPAPGAIEWLRLDVATCPGCQRTNTLSLHLMSREGKRRDDLVVDARITEDDLRTVQHLGATASDTPR